MISEGESLVPSMTPLQRFLHNAQHISPKVVGHGNFLILPNPRFFDIFSLSQTCKEEELKKDKRWLA